MTWAACPRPPGTVDIRQFRIRGDESCDHAKRILGYAAYETEGSCDRGCRHEGYTCLEHLRRLTQNSGLSLFTYVDDICTRDTRQARWRIVFH